MKMMRWWERKTRKEEEPPTRELTTLALLHEGFQEGDTGRPVVSAAGALLESRVSSAGISRCEGSRVSWRSLAGSTLVGVGLVGEECCLVLGGTVEPSLVERGDGKAECMP